MNFFQIVRGCGAPLRRGALCLSTMSSMGSSALGRINFVPFSTTSKKLYAPCLKQEKVAPCIELQRHMKLRRPTKSEIRQLTTERDALPGGRRIYELILTYDLFVKRGKEVEVGLHDMLYVCALCRVDNHLLNNWSQFCGLFPFLTF